MKQERSIKTIIHLIADYYEGKQIKYICTEQQVDRKEFNKWLEKYKPIALELVALRLDNKKMRQLLIDLIFKEKINLTVNNT